MKHIVVIECDVSNEKLFRAFMASCHMHIISIKLKKQKDPNQLKLPTEHKYYPVPPVFLPNEGDDE